MARVGVNLLGDNPAWGVPLAALLGIAVYIYTEASLPMVAALMRRLRPVRAIESRSS